MKIASIVFLFFVATDWAYAGSPFFHKYHVGPEFSQAQLKTIQGCFKKWEPWVSQALGQPFQFAYQGRKKALDPNDSFRVIRKVDLGANKHGFTDYPPQAGGDIQLNLKLLLRIGKFEEVICHEIGHFLGVGHSPDRKSLMYRYADRRQRKAPGKIELKMLKERIRKNP